MPSLRVYRASDEFARDVAARIGRWLLFALGVVIMLAGLVLTPLPFHVGLPLLVIGLMIVLRSSVKAKRRFLEVQQRHPKLVFPIRRLMRREPEIVLVFWQQTLRIERVFVPRRLRFAVSTRRRLRRRTPRA